VPDEIRYNSSLQKQIIYHESDTQQIIQRPTAFSNKFISSCKRRAWKLDQTPTEIHRSINISIKLTTGQVLFGKVDINRAWLIAMTIFYWLVGILN